ncbi:GNAT family N-acetyltransferase [uncultured Kiloniella sp.]|uniref:GNAT family N-acetyltransferase n=1 Tax=uncultured Kiloniella sp. TaxID=1133091 RepID=UPI00261B2648|nr:GNAT family N-acetyltransferase [uncultured Kiloniella sp.]
MPTHHITVREITENDIDNLYDLIIAIARHHDQEQYVLTTPEKLREDAFPPPPETATFGALLAEVTDAQGQVTVAGYASFTWNYSIWSGGRYMNIDDVFVWNQFRGQKVGENLMLAAQDLCKTKGVERLRWEVQQDNHKAIKFYQRLGARVDIKGVCKWAVT